MRKYLKELRQKHRMTQQDVAKKLGISTQYYQLLESGKRQKKLDLTVAAKLSAIFGVTVDFIISSEEKIKLIHE